MNLANLQIQLRAHKAKALIKIIQDPSQRKAKMKNHKMMNQVILPHKVLYIN